MICSYLIETQSGRTIEIHRDIDLPELQGRAGNSPAAGCESGRGEALRLGQIYIGRVEQVHLNLKAAFVRISADRPACFLPLANARSPLYTRKGSAKEMQQGDELVVQVVREAIKTKAAALSAALAFQGRYVLLDASLDGPSVSRKLDAKMRRRLLGIAGELSDPAFPALIRTNAASASREELIREGRLLRQIADHLREIAAHRPAGTCLYDPPASWLVRLRDIDGRQLEKAVTDDERLYAQLQRFAAAYCPDIADRLVFYRDRLLAMDKLYSLEKRMREALSRTVLLRSGASLIIEPTEALTVIDVNSARSIAAKKKAGKEAAALKVNLEAAKEIARQLRLRSMSGIIIADFINMDTEESKQRLLRELAEHLKADPAGASVVDMTGLNLVEMTRRKIEKPIWETGR